MNYAHEQREVFKWLRSHYSQVLVNPQSVFRDDLQRILHEAVIARNLDAVTSRRLNQRLMEELVGAGVLSPYLEDPTVTEIMLVGTRLYIERYGRIRHEATLASSQASIELAQKMAEHCGEEYQTTRPLMNLTWPENGARINLVHHCISPTGVAMTIRKRNQSIALNFEDLLKADMLTESAGLFLVEAARSRMNMLFSGPPGSGKTTLLRAVAEQAIDVMERLIVLEDTEELRLLFEHMMVFLGRTEDITAEERMNGVVTIYELFRNTLRQRFDRLIIGELRGIEVFDLIQAAITAEGGIFSTIHLRSPDAFLPRLLLIAQRAGLGAFTLDVLRETVPLAIDLIVQVDREATGFKHVTRIVESQPDGTWRDLFRWDASQNQLTSVNALTLQHAEWMAVHRSHRMMMEDRLPAIAEQWSDLLLPIQGAGGV